MFSRVLHVLVASRIRYIALLSLLHHILLLQSQLQSTSADIRINLKPKSTADWFQGNKMAPKDLQLNVEINPAPQLVAPEAPRHSRTTRLVPLPRRTRQVGPGGARQRLRTRAPSPGFQPLPKGSCSVNSCRNGAVCQDIKTSTNELAYSCLCRLGYDGIHCERETPGVRFPKFTERSYLAFPENILVDHEFNLIIYVRPEVQLASGGLLLFKNSPASYHFVLGIEHFFFVLRLENPKSQIEIAHHIRINMSTPDRWYKIEIIRNKKYGKLIVDDIQTIKKSVEVVKIKKSSDQAWVQPANGDATGSSAIFRCDSCLYVGGHPQIREVVKRNPDLMGFMESSFLGCTRQLTVNSRPIDMRRLPFYGHAVDGLGIERCSTKLCDQTKCINDALCHITDKFQAECHCSFGFGGQFCEKQVVIKMPQFNGKTYVSYFGLKGSSRSDNQIFIRFRPQAPSGIILYQGYSLDKRGDFISIYLINNYAWVTYDLGSGAVSLRSSTSLSNNQWHTLRFRRVGRRGTLELLNKSGKVIESVLGYSPGQQLQLTIQQDLYLGGVDTLDRVSAYVRSQTGFVGCIQMLFVDSQRVRLVDDLKRSRNLENCESHPCGNRRNRCWSDGKCLPDYDEFVCSCPLGFIEKYCQTNIQVSGIRQPAFDGGSGYLVFFNFDITTSLNAKGFRMVLVVNFKSMTPGQILLHLGSSTPSPVTSDAVPMQQYFTLYTNTENGLSLRLCNGVDQISVDLLKYLHMLSDQVIRIDKEDKLISISFNNSFKKDIKLTYNRLTTATKFDKLFIGGTDLSTAIMQQNMSTIRSGIYGCIKLFSINNRKITVKEADDGRSVSECGEPLLTKLTVT